ncbi:MAG: hypothetical protein LBC29_07040, partial [Propionibacteriaceae bacterium]|nr:hypothetical protein [Propionibacteriaceae bacterium]
AFSAEGIYRINMTQRVTLPNGQTSSDTEVLVIVVGDVNPATAVTSGSGCGILSDTQLNAGNAAAVLKAAQQVGAVIAVIPAAPNPGSNTTTTPTPTFTPETPTPTQDNPVPLLLSILGLLLGIGAAGAGLLWRHNHRRGAA